MLYVGQQNNPVNFGRIAPLPTFQSLQQPNLVGQLSLPNLYAPTAMLGLSNLNNLSAQNTDRVQTASAGEPSPCNPFTGQDCTVTPLGKSLDNYIYSSILPTFKNIGLLLLALILIAFGLYLLANSTDTGKAVINIAKTAAVA